MVIEFTDSQKQKKVFILGATGFIGFAVTKRLVEMGFENIYCLYRSESRKDKMFRGIDTSAITFLHGDATQLDVLREGVEDADIVVNASGQATDWGIKQEVWEVNVDAPKAMVGMIEEMGALTHYIQITSAGVYGFAKEVKTEASPLVKSDRFYTASKVEIHSWLREEIKRGHRFPITILAPSIVWGPGDRIYIPTFKDRLKTKQLFYIGKGEGMDLVHIDDLVDGILRCFFNEQAYNKEYILSGYEPFTFREYIEKIAEFSELPPPTLTVPAPVVLAVGFLMECLARLVNIFSPRFRPLITRFQVRILSQPFRLNIAKARSELGYDPKINFAKGIDGLREYVRQCSLSGIDAQD
jgi:nucleoside-diphosphate-sugar epimerase